MYKWIVDGEEFYDSEDVEDYIRDHIDPDDFEDEIDDQIDEIYGEVDIAGSTFNTSYALKELDPTGWRVLGIDLLDNMVDDIWRDIDRMYDGDTEDFFGYTVECIEEPDEDEEEYDEDEEE